MGDGAEVGGGLGVECTAFCDRVGEAKIVAKRGKSR